MIIFIFLLIIILILIICSIIIGYKGTCIYGGGGNKEELDTELNHLTNNLNTIYKKIEYNAANELTIEDIGAQRTKTDIINNIIRENKKNIDYYKVTRREKADNIMYSPGDKIYLDKLEDLIQIGHVPEGYFFLKNGKIINI
jgi:hypothetical protein